MRNYILVFLSLLFIIVNWKIILYNIEFILNLIINDLYLNIYFIIFVNKVLNMYFDLLILYNQIALWLCVKNYNLYVFIVFLMLFIISYYLVKFIDKLFFIDELFPNEPFWERVIIYYLILLYFFWVM